MKIIFRLWNWHTPLIPHVVRQDQDAPIFQLPVGVWLTFLFAATLWQSGLKYGNKRGLKIGLYILFCIVVS